jgi:thiol-disulfide isomerase/thioredoxin
MNRLIVITATLLFAASSLAADSGQRVDFSLFESAQAIGDGAIEPRPAEDETLLLQFWASWCHSCSSIMWDMDELLSQNDGVGYVAVSIDDDIDAAETYIRRHGLYQKYSDRYFVDTGKALSESLGVNTVPTILLVDADGQVLVRKRGHLNAADLRDFVVAMRKSD